MPQQGAVGDEAEWAGEVRPRVGGGNAREAVRGDVGRDLTGDQGAVATAGAGNLASAGVSELVGAPELGAPEARAARGGGRTTREASLSALDDGVGETAAREAAAQTVVGGVRGGVGRRARDLVPVRAGEEREAGGGVGARAVWRGGGSGQAVPLRMFGLPGLVPRLVAAVAGMAVRFNVPTIAAEPGRKDTTSSDCPDQPLFRGLALTRRATHLAALGRRGDAVRVAQEAAELLASVGTRTGTGGEPQAAAALAELLGLLEVTTDDETVVTAVADLAESAYRSLAATRTGIYDAPLAAVLVIRARLLAAAGREDEAAAVEDEVAALYGRLEAAHPGRWTSQAAGALHAVAVRHVAAGRLAEARPLVAEIVRARRGLASDQTTIARAALAAALMLQAQVADDGGLASLQEAGDLYGRLAETYPAAFGGLYATALAMLGRRLAAEERPTEAVTVLRTAVAAYRELPTLPVSEDSLPELAEALVALADVLQIRGSDEESASALEEATGIYRDLAARAPDQFGAAFLSALDALVTRLHSRDRCSLALVEELAEVCRSAAEDDSAQLPRLATAYHLLALHRGQAGRSDGLAAAQQAVRGYRQLAAQDPDTYHPRLAEALTTLAVWYDTLDADQDALTATEETLHLYRSLATTRPDDHLPHVAATLHLLATRLARTSPFEAVAALEESTGLYHLLATRHGNHTADYAASLTTLASWYLGLGRPDEAVSLAEQALTICHQLAEADPEAHRSHLHHVGLLYSAALTALHRPA